MQFALPGKKVQALIIIVIALFGAYFLYKSNIREQISSFFSKDDSSPLIVAQEGKTFADVDTDADGLKDWQESLWNTDKDNADTDGDGTPDGKEVENGRDPSIKGPDDALNDTRGVSIESLEVFSGDVSGDPDNVTQTISQSLLTQFMTAQSSGADINQATDEIVANTLAFADPGSIPPRYTIADIKIIETNASNLKAYGNDLARIIVDFQKSSALITTTGSALSSYASIIESIRLVPVPGSLTLNQVRILNSLNVSHQTLSMIVNYDSDPAKALIAMKAFQQSVEDIKELFKTVANEMEKNAIIFNQEEPGIIWNDYQ